MERDLFRQIGHEVGISIGTVPGFLTFPAVGDCLVRVGNTEHVSRIDCYGFFPDPRLPGIVRLPTQYGRVCAQLDMAHPVYVAEALRSILHALVTLHPRMDVWTREYAPIVNFDDNTRSVLSALWTHRVRVDVVTRPSVGRLSLLGLRR